MHHRLADAAISFTAPQAGSRVLDVATGTGLVLRSAVQYGLRESDLYGIDISSQMVREAARHLPAAHFDQADAAHLPFSDCAFDLITCVSALPYFRDSLQALREWWRVLAPDGRVVLSAFTRDGLTGPALVRRAAAQHGLVVEDPNAPWGSVDALQRWATAARSRLVRHTKCTIVVPGGTAEQLLAITYPFPIRDDLSQAPLDIRAAVGETLTTMVDETTLWTATSLIVELHPDPE